MHFETPVVARLQTVLDVARGPRASFQAGVVDQVDAAIILVGAGAPEVKEKSWHLKGANAPNPGPFLSGLSPSQLLLAIARRATAAASVAGGDLRSGRSSSSSLHEIVRDDQRVYGLPASPAIFEDHYETARRSHQSGREAHHPRMCCSRGNVVDLMEALRRSVGSASAEDEEEAG
jgi:hypothetical protein